MKLADGLTLPLDTITERLGFLGQSGSGKTYAAMRLAELMLDAGAQVIALDPVGPWWGLRAAADGKSPGFAISVFGGIHGDVPLTPSSGAMVADVLVEKEISAVLDVSDFTIGQMHQFVTDFAERFFERKKRAPTPVHIFFEEAHTFMPERLPPDPKAAVMLHRVERIVRVGRNYGIGSSQLSQMPQAVSKRALNQIACLFAMRTLGVRERKAIGEWFDDHATGTEQLALKDQLPKLETGTAYVASPSWLKVFKKVRVTEKTTFDSSATPKFGAKVTAPKTLAMVDVEALRAAMAVVVTEAEKDDPAALRRRVAELERQLKGRPVEQVKVEVRTPYVPPKLRQLIEEARRAANEALISAEAVELEADKIRREEGSAAPSPVLPPPKPPSAPVQRSHTNGVETGLKRGAREMLRELAALHPKSLTRRELATRAVMAHSSGTFGDYLSSLRRAGYVEEDGNGDLVASAAGLAAAGAAKAKTSSELVALWGQQLKRGARVMLDGLMYAEAALDRAQLASHAGLADGSGTFGDYLSSLRRAGVADQVGRQWKAGHALFLGDR